LSKGEIFMNAGKSGGGFQPGEKVRAIVVDVNGAVVLLAIEALDPKAFDAEMTAVQPILDSIVWNSVELSLQERILAAPDNPSATSASFQRVPISIDEFYVSPSICIAAIGSPWRDHGFMVSACRDHV
jgi:hypothetical protein